MVTKGKGGQLPLRPKYGLRSSINVLQMAFVVFLPQKKNKKFRLRYFKEYPVELKTRMNLLKSPPRQSFWDA